MLALPFGRMVFCAGVPIAINGPNDEISRTQVEQAMNALVEKADEAVHA